LASSLSSGGRTLDGFHPTRQCQGICRADQSATHHELIDGGDDERNSMIDLTGLDLPSEGMEQQARSHVLSLEIGERAPIRQLGHEPRAHARSNLKNDYRHPIASLSNPAWITLGERANANVATLVLGKPFAIIFGCVTDAALQGGLGKIACCVAHRVPYLSPLDRRRRKNPRQSNVLHDVFDSDRSTRFVVDFNTLSAFLPDQRG
jgi:hypothetical protein